MHSQLNAQLMQAIQQELAAERSIAEHRRALREDRGPGARWRRWRLRRLVVAVVPSLGSVAGTADTAVGPAGAPRLLEHR
jgi:hypothetical protein